MKIALSELTDRGLVRPHNEDSIYSSVKDAAAAIQGKGCVFAIADGVGGLVDGEVASQMAVDAVREAFENSKTFGKPDWIRDAMKQANLAIYAANSKVTASQCMATTLTVTHFIRKRLWIGHVGDCRVYRIRKNDIQCLTTDHSRDRFILYRALGPSKDVEVDLYESDAVEGDIYLNCSDGLYPLADPVELLQVIGSSPMNTVCQKLVDLANERGGPDNTSVQVVRLTKE